MRLTEDRVSHIAHIIADGIWRDDLVDFTSEEDVLKEVKKVITNYLRAEDEVDDMVRDKIRSMSRTIPEGGREWEVLYKKYYQEEMAKKGL